MSRSKTGAPLNRKKKEEKVNKVKRENVRLRNLVKRQRRDLKAMRAILINVRRSLDNGNILRAVAFIPEKIKYPPAELTECKHELGNRYVTQCKHCKEVMP